MNIFEERGSILPYEYLHLLKYKDAIRHSYWLHSEFNMTEDISEYKTVLTESERTVIKKTMLAIAQVEVSVKAFWGDLYKRMPKYEIQSIGATFSESECYSDDTEILTTGGWKLFNNLKSGDKVAQYNQDSGVISFTKYTNYYKKPYEGEMHHYKSLKTDLMVTPNHELLTKHPKSDHFIKKRSDSGKFGRNYQYPSAGKAAGEGKYFTDLDRLIIAIQADGTLRGLSPSVEASRYFNFKLKKVRKIKRLEKILVSLGVEYSKKDREKGFVVISGQLPDDIQDINTIKNFDCIDLEQLSYNYCVDFIEEVKYWDSTKNSNSTSYYNTNEKAVDKVQAIALLAGYTTNKGINRTEEQSMLTLNPDGNVRQSAKTCYNLGLTRRDSTTYPHKSIVDYKGYVYCVTVPDGNVVTRRGRRVAISGNSRHFDAYQFLLEKLGMQSEFSKVKEIPELHNRVKYLKKYLDGTRSRDNRVFTKSLVLFSLFIEHVSLFSQFLIIMSFNKERNTLNGMCNVVEATSKEEDVHGNFGIELVNIIKKENPEWFDEEFNNMIYSACKKSFKAESEVIDWIFSEGELEFLPPAVVKEYIKKRFNNSLVSIGLEPIFDISHELIEKTLWMDVELKSKKEGDFFFKKQIDYSKKTKSVDANELF